MPVFQREDGKVTETFTGCVIALREMNGYNDSDFYALVWDETKGIAHEVFYDTTRCGTGGSARIDATEEVKAKYAAFREKERAQYRADMEQQAVNTPDKGKLVKVLKSRKVAVGSEGVVFWFGADKYNRAYWHPSRRRLEECGFPQLEGLKYGYSAGVEFADGTKAFIKAENLEVIKGE